MTCLHVGLSLALPFLQADWQLENENGQTPFNTSPGESVFTYAGVLLTYTFLNVFPGANLPRIAKIYRWYLWWLLLFQGM